MSASKIETLRIDIRQGYDVHIGPGLLAESGALCARLGMKKAVIVTDSNVAALYLPTVEKSLADHGIEADSFVFPAGEKNKTMHTLADALEFFAQKQLTRADFVVALGGGVVGDLAGFAAACYLRGVRYVQMPTTLLAAVDSSVGGKTAVDLACGKNLAGAFKQPEAVICDTDCIAALPAEIFAEGAAEVIKTAVLSDESLFALCENGGIRENLQQVICRCVAYKGRIVAEDEFEHSVRKLLNLGHTVGHAIEKCSGYSVSHGRAVASGLGIISRYAANTGLCTAETCRRIENTLVAAGLPTGTDFGAGELYAAALADKKRAGAVITLILPRAVGSCELMQVPVEQLLPIIASGLEETMNVTIEPRLLRGSIPAVASKSDVHRKLICAALAQGETYLPMNGSSEDIDATVNCLAALGAQICAEKERLKVTPIGAREGIPMLDCGESGSTLRFMLPVALAVTDEVSFSGRGRLPERPIGVLMDALKEKGVSFSSERLPFTARGKMTSGVYAVPGDISSQFITGLLLALPFAGGGEVRLTTPLRSAEYVDITVAAMACFGVPVERIPQGYLVPAASYISPGTVSVEGDWSNAAFFLTAGAIGGDVTVTGLDPAAAQGDKKIVRLLRQFGARVEETETSVRVCGGRLRGCSIDIDATPDLLPILSVAAACAEGETLFHNAARLRLKESDRLESTAAMLRALGGHAEVGPDWLRVYGASLAGGTVDACHDHRIAMSAAVAAGVCGGSVQIMDALCVGKSYPKFYEDLRLLGGTVR